MIHQNTIYTAGIETEEQVSQLTERISNMIGVHQVNINIIDGQVTVSYETPANLNVAMINIIQPMMNNTPPIGVIAPKTLI